MHGRQVQRELIQNVREEKYEQALSSAEERMEHMHRIVVVTGRGLNKVAFSFFQNNAVLKREPSNAMAMDFVRTLKEKLRLDSGVSSSDEEHEEADGTQQEQRNEDHEEEEEDGGEEGGDSPDDSSDDEGEEGGD